MQGLLPNRGDAICFELALAWKEVVGCSQNQSERTWEASPYGPADFRNQSPPSRCLIKNKKKKENTANTFFFFCPENCFAQLFSDINPIFSPHIAQPTGNKQPGGKANCYLLYQVKIKTLESVESKVSTLQNILRINILMRNSVMFMVCIGI